MGAQAELLSPVAGVSSITVGYDATYVEVDASVGINVGGNPVLDTNATDAYLATMRLAVPVHRGIRSDFSLVLGGGAIFINPPSADTFSVGNAIAGARFRIFQTPNIALGATIGATANIRRKHSSFTVGARPLGGASVVYYFR